ncbi:hypothetical protein [Streptomyces canus]|uniref:hypothetical protein n=1 Tax=Streptomyces canus TaxID=58343 RepID=UPI0027D89440|nr:hypothetical protein [Streptomyces canus]
MDFDDADHASGVVYCRVHLEQPSTGHWEVGELQYWDSNLRVNGEWCFRRRKFHRWYLAGALSRPAHGTGDGSDPLGARQLPESFPTWAPYRDSADSHPPHA